MMRRSAPLPKQMGRETVAEQMRINIRLQTGTPRDRLHDLPDAHGR